ncbi:MAG: amidohydrolase family protein [Terriglobia bacterium]|nr:amidohydrolase family protein [Terriglobia bacterium]
MKHQKFSAKVLVLITVLVTLATIVQAQENQNGAKRIVIRAGRLLNVRTGQILHDQDIIVEDGLIKSVGKASAAQESGTVINLPNATVLPGLIDAHDHITGDPSISDVDKIEMSNARRALKGARNARVTLFAGFTTIRNVGADGYPDVALRDAINDGDVIGPHILAAGPAITIDGGSCDNIRMAHQYHYTSPGVADGVEGVQHKVREVIKYGADVIKMCATGGLLSPTNPGALEYSMPEMQMIVAEAHRHGRRVAAHAHGAEGIRLASEAGVDSIEHGFLIDDAAIATMKKNGTYLVPTAYVIKWIPKHEAEMGLSPDQAKRLEAILNEAKGNLRKAFAAGVKVAFGTDAAVFPHGENAREFSIYVELGMTSIHAIQTATINGADLLGLKDKTGAIEPGKWADIIAVDGDPTADVRTLEHIKFVMKSGTVYKNEYAAPAAE